MKSRCFTKFCGITTIKDAKNAELAGCDAIGFVFVRKSKRYVSIRNCQNIIDSLAPTTLTVALFSNNTKDEIQQVLNTCRIHVLQFHGNESADFCSYWNKPYWKAIPMADNIDPLEYASHYADAQGYLIDNFGIEKSGGSGSNFDWDKIPSQIDDKWILAGGLNPKNVLKARKKTKINNFDVSSGIEISPGKKSIKLMKKFIRKLND